MRNLFRRSPQLMKIVTRITTPKSCKLSALRMRRDKALYTASAEKAGLKMIAKFTPGQAAFRKRELSFEQWRVVKRLLTDLLTDAAGRDVVGSENSLREYLNENTHFQYEAGTFKSQLGNKVTCENN